MIHVISFPNSPFSLQKDLQFGIEQDIDVVFASFIRKAKDIEDIKKELGEKGKHIWIISKVCVCVCVCVCLYCAWLLALLVRVLPM